jgi:hypothetical protein
VGVWVEVGESHAVQILEDGKILWEHDTPPGYRTSLFFVKRHMVSSSEGATWKVDQAEPLSLSPSLNCDVALGGCGVHGFIRNGKWMGV